MILHLEPFPVLKTNRLLLRKLTMDDRYELMWLRSDERVNKYLEREKCMDIKEAADFIERIDKSLADGKSVYWVIGFLESPTLIGAICLWNFVTEKDLAELGYELSSFYHGKGLMQEAVEKVIEYGFNTLGLKTIIAIPHKENERSVNLLVRNGFRKDEHHHYLNRLETGNHVAYYLLNE